MSNAYEYWRAVLRGETPDVVEQEPMPGFYERPASKDGRRPRQAYAIWQGADGRMLGKIAGAGRFDPYEKWVYLAKRAIPEHYWKTVDTTGVWPDEPPAKPRVEQWNLPSDPLEAMRAQIDGEKGEFDAWLKKIGGEIANEDDARKASHWADRVEELTKAAEAKRKELKKPHDDASKAVQTAWKPVVDEGESLKTRIKAVCLPWLLKKEREEAETNAAKVAAGEPIRPLANPSVGATGRKVSLRTDWTAEIVDYDAALAFFAGHDEVRDIVQRLANRVAKAGADVPGCKRVPIRKAA